MPRRKRARMSALERGVDLGFADETFVHGRDQRRVGLAAVEFVAVLHRKRGGLLGGRDDLVLLVDVLDRVAVGDDVAVETPVLAQDVLQQALARAARLAVDAVVRTHDRIDLRLLHERLERRQVGFVEVALARMHVETVALRLGPAVHREMLGGGVELAVRVVLA